MRRRRFIALLGSAASGWAVVLALPSALAAQQMQRTYRIGFLRVGQPPRSFIEPLRQGLNDLGYIEGQNLIIDFGLATTAEQLPEVASALVSRGVDLIFASGAAAVLPAKDAAKAIPVVFVAGIDPIASGLTVRGLAQPGGNVTGLTTIQIDLTAKRMQLLKELVPSLTRIAFLWRESNPGGQQYIREAERAAEGLHVQLQPVPARDQSEFEEAFKRVIALGADALVPMDDAVFTSARRKLVELAKVFRLPGVYPIREFVVSGGLISLGPKYEDVYRRAATYVDKVLKGAKPLDLPVEQPTIFETVVNLKTARDLGITVPPTLLTRADEVIE